jgi:endoglucanase
MKRSSRVRTYCAESARMLLLAMLPATLLSAQQMRVSVAAADRDLLAVTIDNGEAIVRGLVPYQAQPGDSIRREAFTRYLFRGGQRIGGVAGPEGRLMMREFARVNKVSFDAAQLDNANAWRIVSGTFESRPRQVSRKSKPMGVWRVSGDWNFNSIDRHVVYLRLTVPLETGRSYRVEGPTGVAAVNYRHSGFETLEAWHVNHLGFRPDDSSKIGFLSLWLGSGGVQDFGENRDFEVLNAAGTVVLRGKLQRRFTAGTREDELGKDHTRTHVWSADFSALRREGLYKLQLPGVGASHPFVLSWTRTWERAFRLAARGYYHHRSGVALGAPFTDYIRPRPFHPDDGMKIYQSNTPLLLMDDTQNEQDSVFRRLVANVTNQIVPNAWGGWMDAGDWDRRAQHLKPARVMMMLYEMLPARVAATSLNIPKAATPLPDLLEEALWCVEFFQRIQREDGGVRGGIESAEHPSFPETSWMESLPVMAFAPDMWSSYEFASAAAQAARLLQPLDAARSQRLAASARRAMQWAERQWLAQNGPALPHFMRDARNLAALQLWRLQGETADWNMYREHLAFTSAERELDEWQLHDQAEAAVSLLLETRRETPANLRGFALSAVERSANARMTQGQRTGFGWTKNPWAPTGWGILGSPYAEYLVYGVHFTRKPEFLSALLNAAQFSMGANPSNMTFTTRMGYDYPRLPLHVDSDHLNVPPPEGIVLYGPVSSDIPPWSLSLWEGAMFPAWRDWPVCENYVNLGILDANTNEYTVMQSMQAGMFVWGYLALRDRAELP